MPVGFEGRGLVIVGLAGCLPLLLPLLLFEFDLAAIGDYLVTFGFIVLGDYLVFEDCLK